MIEIKPEAEFRQHLQLEPRDQRSSEHAVAEMVENPSQRVMHQLVRIALGQETAERREMRHAKRRVRRHHQVSRAQPQTLDHIVTEMLVEPRPPGDPHDVPGLQHRSHAGARPSPHEPQMPPVRTRHHFQDGVRLAMPARAENDAFVGPIHR